jgi:hypothetical protein
MTRNISIVLCAALLAPTACSDESDGNSGTSGGLPPGGDSTDTGEDDGDDAPPPDDDSGDGKTGDDGGDGDTGGGDSGGGDTGTDSGGAFIQEPDGGNADVECDIWAQDCPEDQKCMPWANDGGTSWNATRCANLDPNPVQPGDDCETDGSDVSGNDNCAKGSMCFSVNPETNVGTCVAFCTGNANAPVCDDPGTLCNISNDGVLALCLTTCDPLLQDCPQGGHQAQGCYPVYEDFLCWPDFSFDLGAYGDPCEYFNVCDPGLFCALADIVPGCAGSQGCCTEYCDLEAPSPNDACSGAGTECIPFYDEGAAPPGFEALGACALPT